MKKVIVYIVLLLSFVILIFGLIKNDNEIIFNKAKMIYLECIGIG